MTFLGKVVSEEALGTGPQTSVVRLVPKSIVGTAQPAGQGRIICKIALRAPRHAALVDCVEVHHYRGVLGAGRHAEI